DRAAGLLEDTGLLRAQGALRHHRRGSAADLLVLLEERARSAIRQRAEMADGGPGRHVLVPVPGRPRRQQHPGVRIMSTTTQAASRPVSALATSATFRTFALVFAMATPVLYVICDMQNLPLFTYHPGTNRIDLGWA